jgi:DNA-binding transcriptional ArsR family regulator
MSTDPNVAAVAALIADPARTAMLIALIDGRALPAGELAYASGVTAQTASSHLAKLLAGGLLAVEREGRHRYYRLAGAHVAQAMEQLAAIRPAGPVRRKAMSAQAKRLQLARRCYDHLAGRLGVAVAAVLEERAMVVPAADKRLTMTPAGEAWLAGIGIDVSVLEPNRRGLARRCLDWTERSHHLAGPLGAKLLSRFCEAGWLRQSATPRLIEVTRRGEAEFQRHLGVDVSRLRAQDLSPRTPLPSTSSGRAGHPPAP